MDARRDRQWRLHVRDARGTSRPPLTNLLPPHGVVQPLLLEQNRMVTGLHDVSAFKHEDGVRVHDSRQSVGDENRDRLTPRCDVANGVAYFLLGYGLQCGSSLIKYKK